MTEALHGMPSIPNHVKMNLNNLLTYDKIKHALTTSPNGKATGMNGIPTDLYKEINNRHKKKEKVNKPSFDICSRAAQSSLQQHRDKQHSNPTHPRWMVVPPIQKERSL